MAMLDRYRKPGGFRQLLALVETCGPAKQEKFLEIIRGEDAAWADAIRTKMLEFNRIFSWNDESLGEVVGMLQDLTLATVLRAADQPLKDRIDAMLSRGRKRKIDELAERHAPTAAEVAAMQMKIIESVRKMAQDGLLRFEKCDPQLVIDDKIEETLSRSHLAVATTATPTAATANEFKIQYDSDATDPAARSPKAPHEVAAPTDHSGPALIELQTLKKKVTELSKENAVLRHELVVARTKLEQIKKIA